jgi:hypothetical protein
MMVAWVAARVTLGIWMAVTKVPVVGRIIVVGDLCLNLIW